VFMCGVFGRASAPVLIYQFHCSVFQLTILTLFSVQMLFTQSVSKISIIC